jgi:phosphoribosyl-AMP cyclohydrolase
MDFDRCMWLSCNKTTLCGIIKRKARLISTQSPPTDAETDMREQGAVFMPRFDSAGLVTAVAVDHASGRLLMLAHMDAEAIAATRRTGLAHFHSRSRGRLWMKGETSGHVLKVIEIRVDCDQDALELRVEPAGPACHTLAPSCFYRRLDASGALERIEG